MIRFAFAAALMLMTTLPERTVSADEQVAAPQGAIVFGGAGRTGSLIVDLLLDKGEQVTVFVRPTTDRSRLEGRDVSFAVGDATIADDVDAAMASARPRVVVNALGGRGRQQGFWERSQMAMTAAARKHGVEELVFLSSVGVGDSAIAYSAEALERFKTSIAERFAAEEDLKSSGLDYVIIRTGIVARAGTPATGNAVLTEDRSVLSPVTRADLAQLTVDCIGNPDCRNKTFATADNTLDISE